MQLIDLEKRRKELEAQLAEVQRVKDEKLRAGMKKVKGNGVIPIEAGSVPSDEVPPDSNGSLAAQNGDSDILKIWGHWREIARLAALGYKQQEICRELGLSTSCVWNAVNKNPLVQEQILFLQGKRDTSVMNVQNRLRELQPIALRVIEEEMMSDKNSGKLRADLAKTVLDRGGNSAVTKHQHAHAVFSKDDLEEIHRRAEEIRNGKNGKPTNVEETTYEEVNAS